MRLIILPAMFMLAFCSLCGCQTVSTRQATKTPHGPAVEGVTLTLEIANVEPGEHFLDPSGLFSDGPPIDWPRLLRITFENQSRRPVLLNVGLEVNGTPTLTALSLICSDPATGQTGTLPRDIGSYFGSFDEHHIALPPGARYSVLLREIRLLLKQPIDPNAQRQPREVHLTAVYAGGFKVFTDNKRKTKQVDQIIRSNTVTIITNHDLPDHKPIFHSKSAH